MLDDPFGVGPDLRFLLFDNSGQLLDSPLKSPLPSNDPLLLSLSDHPIHLLGSLGRDGDFGVLGFLLDLFGLDLELLNSVVQVDDLAVDVRVFGFFFFEFGVFSLDLGLGSANFGLKRSDLVLEPALFFIILG